MRRCVVVGLCIYLCINRAACSAVEFDWVLVENPGNAPDQLYPDPEYNPDNLRFGAVGYDYRISRYEVTNAQYTEFLNAVDPTGANALALYDTQMSAYGGINLNSSAAMGNRYESKLGRGNNPVNWVTFLDAMRFTNWLQNGQGNGSTESGVYTIGNGVNEVRNPSATYFLPSEDEWYKAAYHRNDGVTGNYWTYPTSSDVRPYSAQPPGGSAPSQSNVANVFSDDGVANGYDDGFAVTGLITFSDGQNYLTDVGAYSHSRSPYGTLDQAGNVFEWNEAVLSTPFGLHLRGVRGGAFAGSGPTGSMAAFERAGFNPEGYTDIIGFRVASIPEPATELWGALGTLALFHWRKQWVTSV